MAVKNGIIIPILAISANALSSIRKISDKNLVFILAGNTILRDLKIPNIVNFVEGSWLTFYFECTSP